MSHEYIEYTSMNFFKYYELFKKFIIDFINFHSIISQMNNISYNKIIFLFGIHYIKT